MSKFLLIDHSLTDLGGHHYPYAYNVLVAAQRAGWQPVLVTHRRFCQQSALPPSWRVHALYGDKSYSRYTLDTQAQPASRLGEPTSRRWPRLRGWWAGRVRARHVRRFAADCARLFELESLSRDDQVFFATSSELDLAGLCAFLAGSPVGLDCDWHLQFHFGVFEGREPDYPLQLSAAAAARRSFAGSLRRAGRRRLHFYCTTEQLSVQYRSLGVAPFDTLPYPVHELFRPPSVERHSGGPLRVACLGHSRREKGYGQLPQILGALWRDWFAPGRAQLVLQTRHSAARRALEALPASLGADTAGARSALDFAGFPLPLADYAQLLCSADVGLMLYEPTRYYARCSGVLLEMLCAGVPVLVPAGGWLADQIEPENQSYLDEIASRLAHFAPCPEGGRIDIAAGQQSLLVSCRWRPEAGAGEYLRLEFALQDGSGASLGVGVAILGRRVPAAPVRTLLRLPAGCARVQLSMHNAWHRNLAPAVDPEWALLEEALPMGALGLTIAAAAEVPRLLRDVLEHCALYRARVAAQVASCARAHSGAAVLAALRARHPPSIAEPTATT